MHTWVVHSSLNQRNRSWTISAFSCPVLFVANRQQWMESAVWPNNRGKQIVLWRDQNPKTHDIIRGFVLSDAQRTRSQQGQPGLHIHPKAKREERAAAATARRNGSYSQLQKWKKGLLVPMSFQHVSNKDWPFLKRLVKKPTEIKRLDPYFGEKLHIQLRTTAMVSMWVYFPVF